MFFKCNTPEQCKNLYRTLARRLHPDIGGTNELMILLQESYDNHLMFINEINKSNTKTHEYDKINDEEPIYEKVYDKIWEGDPCLDIIEKILAYANVNKHFKVDFVLSVREYLIKHNYVTASQYNSLVKVFYAFEINKKEKKYDT